MLKVQDRRTTTTKTMVDIVSHEVKVQEEHVDIRVLRLLKGDAELPKRWTKLATEGVYNPKPAVDFEPSKFEITWKRREDGSWHDTGADMFGWRLRKDGSVGDREVRVWWLPRAKHLAAETPDWVKELYEEYHPGTGKHPYTHAQVKTADDDIEE